MPHHYLDFPEYSLNFRMSNLIVLVFLLCPPLGIADISPKTLGLRGDIIVTLGMGKVKRQILLIQCRLVENLL